MKKLLLIMLVLVSITVFSFENQERISFLENISIAENTPVTLSQVYSQLGHSEKIILAKHLKQLILSQLPAGITQNPEIYLNTITDPEFKAYLIQILEFLKSDNDGMIISVLDRLDKDNLIKGHPAMFKAYHQYIGQNFRSSAFQIDKTPAFMKDDFKVVKTLQFSGNYEMIMSNDIPRSGFKPVFGSPGKEIGKMTTVANLPENAIINSIRLADVLNQLSNAETDSDKYSPVDFTWRGTTYNLKKTIDLINVLHNISDFDLVGFEARMGVDYAGFSINTGFSTHPIEIPSFSAANVNGKTVYFPANHSEYLIAVYLRGEKTPFALVKWYMGIPSDNMLHQGTMWKPAVYSRASWCGFKVTDTFKDIESLRKIMHGSTYLMKFFNFTQLRYKFPANGYGVLAVCNDSVSILRTVIGKNPMTSSFPNLRAVNYDRLYKDILERLSTDIKLDFSGYLNVPSDVYPEIYGQQLNGFMIERLANSFPFRSEYDINGDAFSRIYKQLNAIDGRFSNRIK